MKMEELKARTNENQELETGLAERAVWLMKCPALVAPSLQPLPFTDDPYRPAAKVVLSVDPLATEDEETKFIMELARIESGNMPKRYTLDMSKDFIPMSVFGVSSEGKTSVEGKIKNKFDMRPHNENMESYGRLCRERASKYMCKNRQIQVIDNATGLNMRPMPGYIIPTATPVSISTTKITLLVKGPEDPVQLKLIALYHQEKKKVTNRTSEMKRTRRDRREMEEVMFNLFERQSNWTLRLLIQETDQPEQFLKDLLKDLCIYNNKGSNQGTYELKPEYKKATQE